MKTLMVPAAAAALLALAPLAASARTTGYANDALVQSSNPSALTVTLSNGNSYGVYNGALFNQLKAGSHYNVQWQDINGGMVITHISPAN